MKRIEKIALLTKIVQGKASRQDMLQVQRSNGPGGVVIIYEPTAQHPEPDEEVSFNFEGQQVTMLLQDIQAFTRYDPLALCFLPDNHRCSTLPTK